jgi:hypothetical protein
LNEDIQQAHRLLVSPACPPYEDDSDSGNSHAHDRNDDWCHPSRGLDSVLRTHQGLIRDPEDGIGAIEGLSNPAQLVAQVRDVPVPVLHDLKDRHVVPPIVRRDAQ